MAIFTNQAVLSYRNGTVNSNVVTGEILEVISLTKNSLTETYSTGDTVTYVISILNSGNTAINGVTVTDDLGAYPFNGTTLVPLTYVENSAAYYLNGIPQPAPSVSVGTDLVFNNITLPANGNALLIFEASINEFAPLNSGGEIVNTATVSGAGICNEIAAIETITVNNAPSLGITKAVSPATVSENGQLTYTFNIQNFGNTEAGTIDQLVVSDTFAPVLSSLVVSYNGVTWTEGVEYNYDPVTGVFSTVPGNITVPAATYIQDPTTGEWNIIPGEITITATGNVGCNN